MQERAKRKLSAILSADAKGYSRLMGEDEVATVRTLEACREMIAELVSRYRGRVVSIDMVKQMLPSKDPALMEEVVEALRKAGLK